MALRAAGRRVSVWLPSGRAHPDESADRRFSDADSALDEAYAIHQACGATVIFFGLSTDCRTAQRQVDICASTGGILLWERPGCAITSVADGLANIGELLRVWTLNRLYVAAIESLCPKAEVHSVPAVVPDCYFGQDRRRSMPSKPIYGAVAIGRALPAKNVLALAEVWHAEIGPTIRSGLTILGGDHPAAVEYGRALSRLTSQSLWLNREEIGSSEERSSRLRTARLAIFPATRDHMPQALAEAMALGLPIVATGIDAHRVELHHEIDAILVPAQDLGPLRLAVEHLWGDADLARRLGEAARTAARNRFAVGPAGACLSRLVD